MRRHERKKGRLCRVLPPVVFLALSIALFTFAQALLVPHDPTANPEAFLIREYADESGGHDVLFLGDCEVYESFSPVTLWREYGIDAYVCGSPQQLLWHSEAILTDALTKNQPAVVVLGVYGLRYDTPQSEPYNRMALEDLPLSTAKLRALRTSLLPDEDALSYVFPLLRYHDRWSSLTARDFTLLFEDSPAISYHGYLMQTGMVAATEAPNHALAAPLTETAFGEQALDAFDRIVTLCREHGAQLILVKAPTDSWRYPWYAEYDAWVCALSEQYDLPYYNFLSPQKGWDPHIDFTTDTYDGGVHLNVLGAEKISVAFGKILSTDCNVPDRRGDAVLAEAWEEEILRYDAEREEVDPS